MSETKAVLGFTGTGLSRPLRVVARLYYQGILALQEGSDLITLPRAGMWHPRLRHKHGSRIVDHKHRGRQLKYTIWGHSQGAIEVVFQLLRSRLPAGVRFNAIICLAGPLAGSPAANLIRPFELIAIPLRWLFSGIVEMKPGSRSLLHLQHKLQVAIHDQSFYKPHVYLLAAQHDHLVPIESAWDWPDNYPADKVHRVLVVHGEVEVPSDVQVIQVKWGMDHHVTMVLAPEVWAFIDDVIDSGELALAA